MQRQMLLGYIKSLGQEFGRRRMGPHLQKLRLYYLALRHGLASPANVVDVHWDEDLVVDWLKVLRLPPYETAYELRPRGSSCTRCAPRPQLQAITQTDRVFPGGAKIRCTLCGATWLEEHPLDDA